MLFNNNDFDFSFFEIPGSEFQLEIDRNKFANPNQGFQKGNMMTNEYIPYRNFNAVKLVPKNDREQKMLKVMEYAFAITDLNLYLDIHPDDIDAYRLYQRYIEEGKKAQQDYINSYGPLTISNANFKTYEWENKEGDMYV